MSLSFLAACAGDDAATSTSATASESEGTTEDDPSASESGATTTTGESESESESGVSAGMTTTTTDTPTTSGDPTTSDTTTAGTTEATTTAGESTTAGETTEGEGTTGNEGMDADCLFADYVNGNQLGLDYDKFMPVIGSHCKGTNHQEITDIERVVFLGDSVTVGTPPALAQDYYRGRLADILVDRFGLTPPSGLWKQVNLLDGVALIQESGDFASCSEWGARTDDFMKDGSQVQDCLPPSTWDKRTLVVITMGGNDLARVVSDGAEGKPPAECLADALAAAQLMRETVEYLVDPEKFPNGIFVVFANVYEYTDGTADVESCQAANLDPWDNPQDMIDIVVALNETYLEIAVDTQTDMIFMLEEFCGRGYRRDDPMSPCYRGPGEPNLFDLTCIHPTSNGHQAIAELFTAVIDE